MAGMSILVELYWYPSEVQSPGKHAKSNVPNIHEVPSEAQPNVGLFLFKSSKLIVGLPMLHRILAYD